MRNRRLNRTGLRTLSISLLSALMLALPAAALEPGSYEVTTEKLHFRAGPGTDNESLYLLTLGAEVTAVSFEGDWAYAEHQGTFGYVHTDYIALLQPAAAELPAEPQDQPAEGADAVEEVEEVAPAALPLTDSPAVPEGMVKASSLNFRESPTTDSPVIEQLPYGTIVEIVEQQGEWTYISFNSVRGYVFAEYLGLADENGNFFGDADELITFAKQYLGYRYRYGGSSPSTGFDCSGFVKYVYSNFGASLPGGATSQYNTLSWKVARDELQAGDLVFFRSPGSKRIGHVGIYIANGNFIHATKPGDVVSIDTLYSGYYNTYYYGAARVG